MTATVRPLGRTAALLSISGIEPLALGTALLGQPDAVEVVVGAESVLVVATDPARLHALIARAERLAATADVPAIPGPLIDIPVLYDGVDLDEVADRVGLRRHQVVDAHASGRYQVAFVGFAPGFGYLTGLAGELHLPRRAEPRRRVPAGSVAIADIYSAVYPGPSPGGWHLLGRTDAVLFDPGRRPPALLPAGALVRFVPTSSLPARDRPVRPTPARPSGAAIEVVDPGMLTTVQDRGRPGLASDGVPPSGAADRAAAALANRLVGNDESAAVLETTSAGPTIALSAGTRTVAVTGPPGPLLVDGRQRADHAPFDLAAGEELRVGPPGSGLRRYVAFSGGLDVAPTLGSRSTDLLTGLGPPVLAAGQCLALGTDPGRRPGVDVAPVAARPAHARLSVVPGPQHGWLDADGWAALADSGWEVAATSNRIGVRLDGPDLPWTRSGEVRPAGLVTGAVQLTPSGQLVVFGPDHPVTGGYPVIAVVEDPSLDLVAQLRPGERVRLAVR